MTTRRSLCAAGPAAIWLADHESLSVAICAAGPAAIGLLALAEAHWLAPTLLGAAEPAARWLRARTACAHCSHRGAGYAEDPSPVGMQCPGFPQPLRVLCGAAQQHLAAMECRNSFRAASGCQVRSRARFRYGFPYLHRSNTTVLRPSPHRFSIRANPLVHHSTELWGFSTDHGIPSAQKCSQSLTVLAVTRLANARTTRCFALRFGKPSGCAFNLGWRRM